MIWTLPALALLLQGVPSLATIWAGGREYESHDALIASGRRCATKTYTTQEIEKIEAKFEAEHAEITSNAEGRNLRLTIDNSINVYWWAITGDGPTDGNYDPMYVGTAIGVLNSVYNPIGFFFNLAESQQVYNPTWFNGYDELGMKESLRYGTAHDLNIYTLLGDYPLGSATYPFEYKFDPVWDGVMINYLTLPNIMTDQGTPSEYERGFQLAHQVGHWLGLYHTFQDGCRAVTRGGDWIHSTPAEFSAASGCPIGRDSCTGHVKFAGYDPIDNIMDFTAEPCQAGLLPEQGARMARQMLVYRNNEEAPIPCVGLCGRTSEQVWRVKEVL